MTHPHDPPRQWSRPVEEVATAIIESFKAQLDGHPIPGVPPAINSWTATGGTIEGNLLAEAAITRLISLGFINENGIEAMKAEKEAK